MRVARSIPSSSRFVFWMKRAKALLHTAFDCTACASSFSTTAASRSWMCVDGLVFAACTPDMVVDSVLSMSDVFVLYLAWVWV